MKVACKNVLKSMSDQRFCLNDVVIRRVRPDEALKVRNFGEREMTRTFAHLYSEEDLSNYISEAYTEGKYLDWIQSKDHCVFGAFAANFEANTSTGEDDCESAHEINAADDMVAYILSGPCTLPLSEHELSACRAKHADILPGEVKRLYAHPSTFGSGISEKLLLAGIDGLKEEGKRADRNVYLGVYSENPRAIRFYEKNHFQLIGEYTFLVGEQKDREFILKHNAEL